MRLSCGRQDPYHLIEEQTMSVPVCCRAKTFMFLLIFSISLFAQNKITNRESSPQTQPTYRLPIGVVIVDATVTDEKGNPITDLKREDFKVYEDNKVQSIQTFIVESRNIDKAIETSPEKIEPNDDTGIVATTSPSPIRPHMISMMIDDLSSEPEDHFNQVAEAIANFIKNDMRSGDEVGIWSASNRVSFPFSSDKQSLLEQVATLPQKLKRVKVERSACPVFTDLEAQKMVNREDDDVFFAALDEAMTCLFVIDKKNITPQKYEALKQAAIEYARAAAFVQYQETMYQNRSLLIALQQNLRSLRHFDANKSMILFSDGFLRQDLRHDLQDVIEQALRAGVILNSVDIRGVYIPGYIPPDEPFVVTKNSSLRKASKYVKDSLAHEEPLSQLAEDTGGVFFHGNNDLYKGIQQISNRQECNYVLTYAIPPHKPDGRFHSIKVEVNRPGVQVSYRKGYYAPRKEMTFERQKKEDILDALRAPGNLNEIPMGISYNCYRDDNTTYNVSVLMNVGIRRLRFIDEGSRHKNQINMVVVAFDEADHYVKGVEKSIDMMLTDASYTGLLDRGITSKVDFKLPLGRYKIRAIVREAAQGKMGSLTKAIEIP